jgi:putative two-component system response regulator
VNLADAMTAAPPPAADTRATVLVVDDTPANLTLLAGVLSPRWRVLLAPSGAKALALAQRHLPDLIVLDVMMPELDGYEVCRRLKADPLTRDIPVLFLTALNEADQQQRGFDCGAADYISKPFVPQIVLARVGTQIEAKRWRDALARRNAFLQGELEQRLAEVELLRDATLHVMISFAEFRDEVTGQHVKRTQEYVRTLARWLAVQRPELQLGEDEIDHMAKSAPLHDIGKVAIPDAVLLKPGRLDAEEMALMRTHAMQGYEMLRRAAVRMGPGGNRFLAYSMQIARSHHERWDGTGYPDGLAGEAIPLAARLMAVADVYDALISRRPYKEPMSHETALTYVREGSGGHFDPAVVRALVATHDDIVRIAQTFADELAERSDSPDAAAATP